jgi:hypothetical protein
MRSMVAGLLALSVMVSGASAAAHVSKGPLAPGKPAGVRQADIEAGGVLLVAGIVAAAAVIAVVASTTQGSSTSSTSGTTA